MRFGARQADGSVARVATRAALCALALCASSACGGSDPQDANSAAALPEEEPAATTKAKGSGTASPETLSRSERKAQLAIDETLTRVSRVRQLSARGPVRGEVVSADTMVQRVQKTLDEDVPADALRGTAEVLWALGTVPDGFDYRGSVLSMMNDELAGLYDPKAETMFLRNDLGDEARDATLLHELVHALQDQHYGLDRMSEWRDDATDELSALSCLAEGDATSAMLDGMMEEGGKTALDLPAALLDGQMRMLGGVTDDAERVPAILKRSLIAPYVDGLGFIHALRRQGGWAAVDRAWQARPTTTEQILHPEKYAAREAALPVDVPPPPPPSVPGSATASAGAQAQAFELAFHDVWGEQSIRLLFEEWMPLKTAAENASGWGGDRVALYHAGNVGAVAWFLLADDENAAERMLRAFARGVLAKPWSADQLSTSHPSDADARKAIQSDSACRERGTRGPLLVRKRGRALIVLAGPYVQGSTTVSATCRDAERWAELILPGKTP